MYNKATLEKTVLFDNYQIFPPGIFLQGQRVSFVPVHGHSFEKGILQAKEKTTLRSHRYKISAPPH